MPAGIARGRLAEERKGTLEVKDVHHIKEAERQIAAAHVTLDLEIGSFFIQLPDGFDAGSVLTPKIVVGPFFHHHTLAAPGIEKRGR